MSKTRKIKWENIGLLIVLIVSAIIVIHDIYMVTICGWITGEMCGWTVFGFMTFMIALTVCIAIGDYLYDEYTKKDL